MEQIDVNETARRHIEQSLPGAFAGHAQFWQKWYLEFKEFARGVSEPLVNTMEVVELLTENTEVQLLEELFQYPASILMAILDGLLSGTARNVIPDPKLHKNGFEAWRCLCHTYQPSDRRRSTSLRRTVLDFDFFRRLCQQG